MEMPLGICSHWPDLDFRKQRRDRANGTGTAHDDSSLDSREQSHSASTVYRYPTCTTATATGTHGKYEYGPNKDNLLVRSKLQ